MANPLQQLNENFYYNSMLARALLQLITEKEKQIIQVWLTKLHDTDDSSDAMNIRNEYMWFLLLQLQNRRITQPFNKNPPTHKLRPLSDILPANVYEEVLTSTEQNMSWADRLEHSGTTDNGEPPEPPSSPPSKFLGNQPVPRNGIICYFAAFSDQEF